MYLLIVFVLNMDSLDFLILTTVFLIFNSEFMYLLIVFVLNMDSFDFLILILNLFIL
jgi:hypothetical protein